MNPSGPIGTSTISDLPSASLFVIIHDCIPNNQISNFAVGVMHRKTCHGNRGLAAVHASVCNLPWLAVIADACRLRKVKCDEGKPSCRRCQDSGRTCDGYGIWGGGAHADVFQPKCCVLKPVQLFPTKEQSGLEWYIHRSAKKLPGAFFSEHWTLLIFQGSVTEPVIRHAVLAVSSAHREEVKGADCDEQELTTRQYSKAITGVQRCLGSGGTVSIRLILTACLLFIQADFLRGHYQNGLVHLECGLNILQNLIDSRLVLQDGWLITHFTRFLVQAKLFGQLRNFSCRGMIDEWPSEQIDTFRSSHHARRNLEQIMLQFFYLDEQASEPKALIFELVNLEQKLREWSTIVERTLQNTQSMRDSVAYLLLRQYCRIVRILVHVSARGLDSAFDECQSTFCDIIAYSIEVYRLSRSPNVYHDPEPDSPNSLSDMGWIAPLYFTAIKCRNRRIRHQAIRLVAQFPHREGIWSSSTAVALSTKIVQIEEAGFYHEEMQTFDMLTNPTEKDLQIPYLPAWARVGEMEVILPQNKADKLVLMYRRAHDEILATTEYNQISEHWINIEPVLKPKMFDLSTPRSSSKAYQQLLCRLPNQVLGQSDNRSEIDPSRHCPAN